MKKYLVFLFIILTTFTFVSCKSEENIEITQQSTKTTNTIKTTTKTSYSPPIKSYTRYCEASGCTNEGTKSYIGFSGETEYYCYTHYNEIINSLSDMEEDVGNGPYSKHKCEECGREGTHSIIGFSGLTEYYCSTHYYELKELLEVFD